VTLVSLARRRTSLAHRLVSTHESWPSGAAKRYAELASLLLILTKTAGLLQALSCALMLERPESRILLDHVAQQLRGLGELGGLTTPTKDDVLRAAQDADLVGHIRLTTAVSAVLRDQLQAAREILRRPAGTCTEAEGTPESRP
jgi:hypothetical protein